MIPCGLGEVGLDMSCPGEQRLSMPRTRTPGSIKTTRPPLERMNYIHEQLQAGTLPNCSSIAKHFEVSAKTIQRDLDFMRDRMSLPIEWDGERRGYFYTGPVDHMPTATITEGELVALLVAQKAIEQFKGTPFEKPLANAFAKIEAQLDGPVTMAIGEARSAITFRPIGVGRGDLELFRKLSDAVLHSTEIEFDYDKGEAKDSMRRHLQPWHLCCVDNQWYVIGNDIDRQGTRSVPPHPLCRHAAVPSPRRRIWLRFGSNARTEQAPQTEVNDPTHGLLGKSAPSVLISGSPPGILSRLPPEQRPSAQISGLLLAPVSRSRARPPFPPRTPAPVRRIHPQVAACPRRPPSSSRSRSRAPATARARRGGRRGARP